MKSMVIKIEARRVFGKDEMLMFTSSKPMDIERYEQLVKDALRAYMADEDFDAYQIEVRFAE